MFKTINNSINIYSKVMIRRFALMSIDKRLFMCMSFIILFYMNSYFFYFNNLISYNLHENFSRIGIIIFSIFSLIVVSYEIYLKLNKTNDNEVCNKIEINKVYLSVIKSYKLFYLFLILSGLCLSITLFIIISSDRTYSSEILSILKFFSLLSLLSSTVSIVIKLVEFISNIYNIVKIDYERCI